jgi:hypothetical protein
VEIQRGLEAANRAIAENPHAAETYATRGKLYLLQARRLSGSQQLHAARNAEASFLQAIKVKSNIQSKYAADLQEARRMLM